MIGCKSSLCGILLALSAGSCLYANRMGAPSAEFRQSYALQPNGRIVIQNLYGDVQIMAWDRDQVLVQAIKKSSDPRRLNDAQIVVDSSYEKFSVRTQYAGSDAEHPASVDYRIMVPRSANLENVKLINGGLCISGVAGPVKASSVNGNIHADLLEGQAELSTINGQLEAAFGKVTRANGITLSSVNGAIRLSLPAGANATLDASNLSGGIDSRFGHAQRGNNGNRLHAQVRRGGAAIRVRNVNGGISIREGYPRRTARPVT
jgi:Putative adhesin